MQTVFDVFLYAVFHKVTLHVGIFVIFTFGALVGESPRGGAFFNLACHEIWQLTKILMKAAKRARARRARKAMKGQGRPRNPKRARARKAMKSQKRVVKK
jgi:hypothetical protein